MTLTEQNIAEILFDDIQRYEMVTQLAKLVQVEHEMANKCAILKVCRFMREVIATEESKELADEVWSQYQNGYEGLR
jgi:hypothetical protein